MASQTNTLGQEIKRLLSMRGWSQRTLAKMANIGQSTISKIIRDETKPTPETINALAKALEIHPAHFMRLSGIPLPTSSSKRNPSIEYIVQRLEGLPPNIQEDAALALGAQLDVIYKMWESQKQLAQLTALDAKSQI